MALAWFIAPYARRNPGLVPAERYCQINDFAAQIVADGGTWDETEILGNVALVKVRASATTLTAINNTAGFLRVPNHVELSDTLGDLTAGQRTAILNEALALGYSQAEINAALPANWQSVTLGQVLAFFAQRRLRARYDTPSDSIICDGETEPVKPVATVANNVQ